MRQGGASIAMSRRPLTVIVAGMVAADLFQGGAVWAFVQYVLGIASLGPHVFLVEPMARAKIAPAGSALASSINADYFRAITCQFHLRSHAALVAADTNESVGLSYDTLQAVASRCDLL